MNAVSRSVDIPPPRRGRRELNEDTGVRLGLHIKSAEQAMMAAKTEALRSFGLTVAQYAAMLSLYYVPEQSSAQLARAAAVTPQTMATVIAKLEQKRLVTRHPSSDHAKVLIASLTSEGEALLLRADKVARRIEQRSPPRSASSSPRCSGASPPSCGTTSSPSSGQDTADHCCLGPKITTASANRDGSAPCCVSGI